MEEEPPSGDGVKCDLKEVLGRSWGPEAGMSLIGTEESEVGGSV